jgi:hypothetical protein
MQGALFESDLDRNQKRSGEIVFYEHKDKRTNRLIAGDSLVIMNFLLEKKAWPAKCRRSIDPPYGIKHGFDFKPFVGKRNVKEKRRRPDQRTGNDKSLPEHMGIGYPFVFDVSAEPAFVRA